MKVLAAGVLALPQRKLHANVLAADLPGPRRVKAGDRAGLGRRGLIALVLALPFGTGLVGVDCVSSAVAEGGAPSEFVRLRGLGLPGLDGAAGVGRARAGLGRACSSGAMSWRQKPTSFRLSVKDQDWSRTRVATAIQTVRSA